jgi:hypothetical protein
MVLIAAIVISAKRNKHNTTIAEKEAERLRINIRLEVYKKEYYTLCSDNILNIFSDFYKTGNERVSIYKHQGDHFTLLGRYAQDPNHNKSKSY